MSNRMWGGRFATGPDAIMEEINASIDFDKKLWRQDIRGSLAHAAMLAETGILTKDDVATITAGLKKVEGEIESGAFTFSRALEDVHMNVESNLKDKIGLAAGRLHTARSRNDQVATDMRLWVRDTLDEIDGQMADLQRALAEKADTYAGAVMPGFTHLQSAQPVTFGHHLLAYVEMLGRDRSRIRDARARLNECPLGAAALAGTSFPINRHMTAKALGFDRPTANSLDSVSDRDFVLETLSAASICAMHLSRFAEEIVLWSTPQFGFVRLSDAFSTGSSIMPQKRNPDAAELVRGKAGRVFGALQGLLTMMKGLPLTYSKDMQEDKEGTFDALQTLSLCLAATAGMVRDMQPDLKVMKKAAGLGYATATDLADWLVRVLKMPFRDAHHVTGRLVGIASEKKVGLEKLSLAEMQAVEPQITEAVFAVLGVDQSVKSRVSYGGTAPANVRKQARRWLKQLAKG
ncbi:MULTISPECIES: argininosuccinate lyase [Bosea]|uniref:argininosuccinate lyase n=1 Tax=Bosea TaxID=85413 RepID=UPI00214F8A9C|nr:MULTISPECIES: argininosuccinate lyase [Bosea]MCR4523901.1 argininosuccinate lyase [Bosea sp. 47.2.35]MDR6828935.1 argininosuccinate lyase [Bosea robiniae]MDR6895651.1 argininosuccinate lyase [Bosea sp. BE109]MDR7139047.1 argininosuccinate lyase [Bosea sp. BE168]MDR7175915.1 argininosuccinate lyase [Bosea sp. BE271]